MSNKRSDLHKIDSVKKRQKVQDDNANKHLKCNANINSAYLTDSFLALAESKFKDKLCFTDANGAELFQEPFTHFVLPNFLSDEKYVEMLEKELSKLKFKLKNNDLFTFHQTNDLCSINGPYISSFKQLMKGYFFNWLSDVTGIPFSESVDMFCSKYQYTDVLLCHDDELEERRIAYILYLVPASWEKTDGGALELFSLGESGDAGTVAKCLVPKRNCMVFFEVTEASWHQVSEVITDNKCRLSVSGWFRGPPLRRTPRPASPSPWLVPYTSIEEDNFCSWINPKYMDPENQQIIRKTFEFQSEIQLKDFFQKEKYDQLEQALKGYDINWSQLGPVNKRSYFRCESAALPAIVQECVSFLHSDATFLFLSILTGIRLHPDALHDDSHSDKESSSDESPSCSAARNSNEEHCKSRCHSEVRKWQHSCYTLCYDGMIKQQKAKFSLDAIFYIGCPAWNEDYGGFTSYIASEEKDELLRVIPAANCLALVYRDKKTLRFVKYINHQVTRLPSPEFYDISMVYYE